MSELFMYEFQDNVWDEFGENDDHIVPHRSDDHSDQFTVQTDSRKKPRHEVMGVTINDSVTEYGICCKEEKNLSSLIKEKTMLDEEVWSHTLNEECPSRGDVNVVKGVTNLMSVDPNMSFAGIKSSSLHQGGSGFCTNGPCLSERSAADDDNLYPLNQMSQTDNDINFFGTERDDNESNDLFYGWADDIGNFDDVDKIFRSCDTSFGLGSLSNEDNLCWFPSSHNEESTDALRADSQLDSILEHPEVTRPENAVASIFDSSEKSIFTVVVNETFDHLSSPNVSDTTPQDKNELMLNKQQIYKSRKDLSVGDADSSTSSDNLKQLTNGKHRWGVTSCKVYSPSGLQKGKQKAEHEPVSYIQGHVTNVHLNGGHSSDQMSVCISGSKTENNADPLSFPFDSTYVSNVSQSMESIHYPVVKSSAGIASEKRDNINHCQDTQTSIDKNFEHTNMSNMMAYCDLVSAQNQINNSEKNHTSLHEVEGVGARNPAKLDSPIAQESFCASSVLDNSSLEATSFHQLQQVTEQLDIRTKLCIRDSLYRLARSAEQRHKCVNPNGGTLEGRHTSQALMAEEKNECAGFMDIETDTNPIDRSVAHLLFHRPSDPSLKPINDNTLSFKSHAMMLPSSSSPTSMVEKQVEKVAGSEEKLLTNAKELTLE